MITLKVELGVNQRHYYDYEIPLHEVPAELRPDLDNGFISSEQEEKLMRWLFYKQYPVSQGHSNELDADEILEWEIE
jgi:hypothetical protein